MPKAALYVSIITLTLVIALAAVTRPHTETKTVVLTTLLEDELDYWQSLTSKYPTFTDGFLEMAKLQMKLNRYAAAQETLLIAHNINPNSRKINNAVKVLGTRSF